MTGANAADSPYQGLNLPQLMELLNPIVVPSQISWLPQTIGWQILTAWLLTALLLLLIDRGRHYRRNRYRRIALAELRNIPTEQSNAGYAIASLVKRTAMAVYPREDVACLYGAAWKRFLLTSTANDDLIKENIDLLASGAYQRHTSAPAMKKAAQRWIEIHHA